MEKLGWHSLGTSFECPCGVTHELPIEACYLGEGAAAKLAAFAQERCGHTCLVISDENTRQAAGETPFSELSAAGKHITEHVYGAKPFEATEALGDEVAAFGEGQDFFVGIGGGTLCDLAKYAGHKLGKPVLLYGTAASMNGYTSSIVAMKVRGLKRTAPVKPALGVFADPEVIATAPIRMAAAGVGDFLSKNSSSSDWYAAHLLRGDYYCSRPGDFFEGTQEKLLAAAPRVAQRDPEAVAIVLEALLLAGFSMVVAGSSAPASGGEHLISHYLDMKHATIGTPNDLHGTQVGVATVHTLRLWEKVLALDPARIDIDACVAAQPAPEQIREWITEDWKHVAPEVLAQWQQKEREPAALRAELQRFIDTLPQLHAVLEKELLPASVVADAIRASGGPVEPEGMEAPVAEYQNALKYARFLRNRFTILDLAAELCVA